jgi:hypothetical protein
MADDTVIRTSKDVVQRIREHCDSDACQSTLDLLRDAAAEVLSLRAVNTGMIQGLKDADAEARAAHETCERQCEDRVTIDGVEWRCTKSADHCDHDRQPTAPNGPER